MLPTHAIRMPGHSTSSRDHDDLGLASQQGTRHYAYPPSVSPAMTSKGSESLMQRIFGARGLASFTVDVAAPSAQAKVPQDTAASSSCLTGTQTQGQRHSTAEQPKPSRWSMWEFRIYLLIVAVVVPYMAWVPINLSQPSNPEYPKFRGHLEQGWLFGRLRDDSDFQYRSFRDYVPVLAAIMLVYVALSALFARLPSMGTPSGYQSIAERFRPNRIPFLHFFTAIFILALHGANTLKLLLVLTANFALAHALGGRRWLAPAVIWTFNIGTLAFVHWNDGIQWKTIGNGGLAWLDDYNGLLPRWQINFNITMLRLVSFALDLHWSCLTPNKTQADVNVTADENGVTDNKLRASRSRAFTEYSFSNYLAYILYPPLFIAGPIITFNDFVSQITHPPVVRLSSVLRYAVRFLFCLLTMEFILHFMYVNAIKDSHAWKGETPIQLSMVGFWNLIVVWLKLLIPWRFFRLWALADGVDPPENMIRCMANNYSTLGFWRSWHRSYNLWIVRYIYVPVGGSRNTFGLPATFLVFTFVALWHDLSLKLLTWGWLISLFIVPELAAKALLPASKFTPASTEDGVPAEPVWWYRHLCACGGVFNVLLMMTANLVGFAIGVDGIRYMWEQLLGSWGGLKFMVGACATLFVGVQIMFEYREEELRQGISRKC